MDLLCTLSDVKQLLGITDDTHDAKLLMLIKSASAKIEGYIGYSLGRKEYTNEEHAVNDLQLLQLNHFPLQTVTSVTAGGGSITDYKIIPEYARWGRLYRGYGWTGNEFVRGFTHDVVSGVYEIAVTYTAGYYLPNETGYVEGADGSLPYDIVAVCLDLVVMRYNAEASGAIGLKAHTEGHISDTYTDDCFSVDLSASAKKALDKYVFYGVA